MKPIQAEPSQKTIKRKMMTWIFYPARSPSITHRIVALLTKRKVYRKKKKRLLFSLFQDSRVRPVFIHPGIRSWGCSVVMLDDAMCVEDTHNLSKGCFPKTPVDADIKNDMSMRTESDSARDAGAPGPTIGL